MDQGPPGATPTTTPPARGPQGDQFRAWFRHWRSGKLIVAKDYGHKAFPFGARKKKSKKQ